MRQLVPAPGKAVSPCHRPILPHSLIVITCRRRSDGSYPGPMISQHEPQSCQHGPLRGSLVSCPPDAWQSPVLQGGGSTRLPSRQRATVFCGVLFVRPRRATLSRLMRNVAEPPSSELVFDPPGSLGSVGKHANARTIPPILGQICDDSLFFYVSLIWVDLRLEAWRFLRLK